MTDTIEGEAALLQLSSATLPVGAYSYSQGLETAIADERLRTPDEVERAIGDVLRLVIARYEAPVWWRLRAALDHNDNQAFARWNEDFLATRETAELRAETLQMGYSMIELMRGLAMPVDIEIDAWTWPAAHALASRTWRIAPRSALNGYLFGWLENQVLAGMKALPYGQLAGQRMMHALRPALAEVVASASEFPDDALSTQAPGYAITSARHESQYSRLFRS
ncbi:MAG: urease accessory UreF family protein [Burkholderiaceae bacterium]